MKLRFRLIKPTLLSRVIDGMRWSSKIILKFTPLKLWIIAPNELSMSGDSPLVIGQIDSASLFDKYIVESLNQNEISVIISVNHWHRAVGKSAQKALELLCKLTKKEGLAVLSVSSRYLSDASNTLDSNTISITQDIPCEIAVPSSVPDDPAWKTFNCSIMLPPPRNLKKMIDRMRNLSSQITLACNTRGHLKFRVDDSLVQVTTHYSHLKKPLISEENEIRITGSENLDTYYVVSVDMRALAKFLQITQAGISDVVCCLSESHGLLLYSYVGDNATPESDSDAIGNLKYYIPVVET